jgi:molybdopterin-guanine dinucleotide biosynthesis protein A
MPGNSAPVWGLVLAGGRSTRMGADKCALDLYGEPQARHAFALLSEFLPRAFVSVRQDQHGLSSLAGLPIIDDRFEEIGPVSGVLSAMQTHPGVAWLALACDLPLADARSVRTLIENRDPARLATAYMATDGFFEPLFAIFEPAMEPWLRERLVRGKYSLREAMADADVRLVCPPEDSILLNVNTPDDLAAARRVLESRA